MCFRSIIPQQKRGHLGSQFIYIYYMYLHMYFCITKSWHKFILRSPLNTFYFRITSVLEKCYTRHLKTNHKISERFSGRLDMLEDDISKCSFSRTAKVIVCLNSLVLSLPRFFAKKVWTQSSIPIFQDLLFCMYQSFALQICSFLQICCSFQNILVYTLREPQHTPGTYPQTSPNPEMKGIPS